MPSSPPPRTSALAMRKLTLDFVAPFSSVVALRPCRVESVRIPSTAPKLWSHLYQFYTFPPPKKQRNSQPEFITTYTWTSTLMTIAPPEIGFLSRPQLFHATHFSPLISGLSPSTRFSPKRGHTKLNSLMSSSVTSDKDFCLSKTPSTASLTAVVPERSAA